MIEVVAGVAFGVLVEDNFTTVTELEEPWDQPVDATIKGVQVSYAYILTALAYIDVSRNQLTGPIPSLFGALKVLKSLNVSQNLFTAALPESLGLLTGLEALDVSFNNLSGQLPSALLKLAFLAVLETGGNDFSGCIPTGGQFATFNISSYRPNNPGLSGFPIPNSNCIPSKPFNFTTSQDSSGTSFQDLVSILALEIGMVLGFIGVSGFLILSRWFHPKLLAPEHHSNHNYDMFDPLRNLWEPGWQRKSYRPSLNNILVAHDRVEINDWFPELK